MSTITLECDIRSRGDNWIMLRFGDVFNDPISFPRDQINENGDGTVTMPRDLAKRKGIEQYETKIL